MEQYVLQQLVTLKRITPWYWANDRNSAEIDFLIDTGTVVVPIGMKAEINLQANKSQILSRVILAAHSRSYGHNSLQARGRIDLPPTVCDKHDTGSM